MRSYGRITVYANYEEKDILSKTQDEQIKTILTLMPDII